MTIEELRDDLRDRGGAATVWLVYLADVMMELEAGRPALALQRAFFTRGAAYAFAERMRKQRQWQHYYVFTVAADLAWTVEEGARVVEYETAFGRPRRLPVVTATLEQVAGALQR
jgi:hypothetical protein